MKRNIKHIGLAFVLGLTLLFLGCEDSSQGKNTSKEEIEIQEEHVEKADLALELNDGEKWDVNEEMIPAIQSIQFEIKSFSDSDSKDYAGLAQKLQVEINHLTSSCTMTGKSHDELHKWLLPFIDLTKELSEAKNQKEAEAIYLKIVDSIETYNRYFQ